MKKIISFAILFALLVSLCACAKKNDQVAAPAATLDPSSP